MVTVAGRLWCCCCCCCCLDLWPTAAGVRNLCCCLGDDDCCLPPADEDFAAVCLGFVGFAGWTGTGVAVEAAGGLATADSVPVSVDDFLRNAFSQPNRLECVSAALELSFGSVDLSFLPLPPTAFRCCCCGFRPSVAIKPSSAVDPLFSADSPSLFGFNSWCLATCSRSSFFSSDSTIVSSFRLLSIIGRPGGRRSLSVSLLPLDDDSGGLGSVRFGDDGRSSICTTLNRLFFTCTAPPVDVIDVFFFFFVVVAAAVLVSSPDNSPSSTAVSPAFNSPWFQDDLCNVFFSFSGVNLAQADDFHTSSHVRMVNLNRDSIIDFLLRNRINGVPSLVVSIPWPITAGGRFRPPSFSDDCVSLLTSASSSSCCGPAAPSSCISDCSSFCCCCCCSSFSRQPLSTP